MGIVDRLIETAVDGHVIFSSSAGFEGRLAFRPRLKLEDGRRLMVLTSYPFNDGFSASGVIEVNFAPGAAQAVADCSTSRQSVR